MACIFQNSDVAEAYNAHVPAYSKTMFEVVERYCKEPECSGLDLALDLGCGNGNSTVPLSAFFKKVIGVDVSGQQIHEARQHIPEGKDISFIVGPAEDLEFLGDASVDLVTVGMAIHWMDMEIVNKHINRILKPSGSVIVYSRDAEELDNTDAHKYVKEVYDNEIVAKSGIPESVAYFKVDQYKAPFAGSVRHEKFTFERCWSVENFVAYFRTISTCIMYAQKCPYTDVFDEILKRLKTFYTDNTTKENLSVVVTFHFSLICVQKPNALNADLS